MSWKNGSSTFARSPDPSLATMLGMAWDWLEKGTRRLQDLGVEYKQHYALVERLLTLEPAAAQEELARAWDAMNGRARAGLQMTLAGLTLSRQTVGSGDNDKARVDRLKALQAAVERAGQTTAPGTSSAEAAFTAGAARAASRLGDVAERTRPKAEQLVESARKGIEKHGPAVEAALKSVVSELLRNDAADAPRPPTDSGPAPSPANTQPPTASPPPPIPEDRPRAAAPSASAASAGIAGEWSGTLRQSGGDETLDCTLQVTSTGRPTWAYHDTSGFHRTELTHAGQRLQYVPPERGVVTVTVQSVTGSASETGYVVDYSYEGSSNGYLTQRYQRLTMAARLRGQRLDAVYSVAGVSSFGDKTGLAASESVTEYRGSLLKQA
jgi:hypothetical protein